MPFIKPQPCHVAKHYSARCLLRISALIIYPLLLLSGCNRAAIEEAALLRRENDSLKQEVHEGKLLLERQKAELSVANQRLSDLQQQQLRDRDDLAALRKECTAMASEATAWRAKAEQAAGEKMKLEQQIVSAAAERAKNTKGTLVGAVSYFFNQNYGDKPDSGSTIFIVPAAECPGLDQKFKNYLKVKYASINGATAANEKAWKDEGELLAEYLRPIIHGPKATKLLADGSGAFSMRLSPAKYAVIVKSAHRTAMTVAEVSGSMQYFEVEVKPDEQANIAARFYLW
jgi:hypothetical protein